MKLVRMFTILIGMAVMVCIQTSCSELAQENILFKQLEDCLANCYHIPYESVALIMTKFIPLLQDRLRHTLISDFVAKSEKLNIIPSHNPVFTRGALLENDAVLKAPEWHELLYESAEIRVLWGVTRPGAHEPFHMHHWKRIMVIVQGARFKVEDADGTVEVAYWPAGVYEIPADSQPAAYANNDECDFMALSFEIKE